MRSLLRSTLLPLTLLTVLVMLPWLPAHVSSHLPLSGHALAQPSQKLFLPLVRGQIPLPTFTISSPAAGSILSRTSFFAVQVTEPDSVSRVDFKIGNVTLGSDTNGSDGFKLPLDAKALPAGALQLSATATGPTGQATQSVAVTVEPNPPASATASASGVAVATAIGSTIIVPPGGLPAGATLSVSEKSQPQTTVDHGIDWDGLGVTFLGAQQLQSSAALNGPLTVASAGFGSRVQPGQAVVNYQIAPDSDGDGIDELVVINTASVAPNNDVISDPVGKLAIKGIRAGQLPGALQLQADAFSGPPGTRLTITAAGFNPISVGGNIATFRSTASGQTFEMQAVVGDGSVPGNQILTTLIPPLPAGAATMTLRNETSDAVAGPFDLTIIAPAPLPRPALTIIDQFFADTTAYLGTVPTSSAEEVAKISQASAKLAESRAKFQSLSGVSLPADLQQALNDFAQVIANLDIYTLPTARTGIGVAAYDTDAKIGDVLNMLWGLASVGGGIAGVLASTGAYAGFITGASLFGVAIGVLIVGYYACRLIRGGSCFGNTAPANEASCGPVSSVSGNGGSSTTGMGSAPAPGGSGCGNILGGGSGGNLVARGKATPAALAPGRYLVKILPRGGTGRPLTPFSGLSDGGGYFFVPLIPQGEPFTAVATDQLTGASTTTDGVGPITGQSLVLSFDFSAAQANIFAIAIGDTVADGVPGPGAGNIEQATGLDIYTFNAAAGQQVYFDLLNTPDTLSFMRWKLVAPDRTELFDRIFNCCGGSDVGVVTLPQAGTYALRVGTQSDPATGPYSFKLWNVPPPNQFAVAVGDTVANGVPGPGAGNIESPGVKDIYTFSAAAGQQVYFDLLNTPDALSFLRWQLVAPDGTELFDRIFNCCGGSDAGVVTLPQAGSYTINVRAETEPISGTYSFKLWNVPPPNQFAIAVGDTVANGVPGPGAGNIESPGVRDIYTFNAAAGQQVYFDLINTADTLSFLRWQLVAPDGTELFDRIFNCCGGSDPGVVTLPQAGSYTISVGVSTEPVTGVYSFQIRNP